MAQYLKEHVNFKSEIILNIQSQREWLLTLSFGRESSNVPFLISNCDLNTETVHSYTLFGPIWEHWELNRPWKFVANRMWKAQISETIMILISSKTPWEAWKPYLTPSASVHPWMGFHLNSQERTGASSSCVCCPWVVLVQWIWTALEKRIVMPSRWKLLSCSRRQSWGFHWKETDRQTDWLAQDTMWILGCYIRSELD